MQERSFCVLPCCSCPQSARDRCFDTKTRIRTSCRCFVQKGFHFCPVWWSGNKRGLLRRTPKSLRHLQSFCVAPFVRTLTEDVLVPLAAEEEAAICYTFGLVLSWPSGAAARPTVPYLASVPISFPLMGLTQLVQYSVVCLIANLTPGELRSRILGATGHSQGIVSAVVIAASGTFEEFPDNSRKAIKWLFYSGLRGQQAFNRLSLSLLWNIAPFRMQL